MSIALSEFWTRLVRASICDAEGCRKVASAFANANAGTPPSEPEAVARFMVKRGMLTRFQARSLLATPPRELRAGGYVIRTDKTPPPLSGWFEASRVSDGRVGMLLPLRLSESDARLLDTLKRQQGVSDDSLQPLEFELHDRSALVFSLLPEGQCLTARLADRRAWSRSDVCRFGFSLAEGLAALHVQSLVHSQVRADRVWIGVTGDAILLRDPFAVERSERPAPAFLDDLELPASYAAPELLSAAQAPSAASDIYGLGCLLFRLATGRLPFEGSSDAEIRARHVSHTPPELVEAVQRGEAGDPLFRVLAFAMAKLPKARFGSAEQLAKALRATATLVRQEDSAAEVRRESPATAPVAPPQVPAAKAEEIRETPVVRQLAKSEPNQLAKKPREASPSVESSPTRTATVEKPRTPARPMPPGRGSEIPSPPSANVMAESDSSSDVKAESATLTTPSLESKEVSASTSPTTVLAAPDINKQKAEVIAPPTPDQDSSLSRPQRRRRKKSSKAPLVLGALCVAVLMLVIGLIARDPNTDGENSSASRSVRRVPETIPPVSGQRRTDGSTTPADPAPLSSGGYTLIEDNRLLFAPPYPADSPPPPLELLPPGPAVIASLRLSDIAQDATISDMFHRIAPEMQQLAEAAAERAKTPINSIRRLTVALHPGRDGWPEVSLVADLDAPITADDLIARLDVTAARTPEGDTIYVGDQDDSDAYFWVASAEATVIRFAIGSVDRITEVASAEGARIPLPTALQALWDSASRDADMTVLFHPNFLFADGRAMLESSAPSLVRPLRQLMQPDVATALITVDWCNHELAFVEARFAPSGGISQPALMQKVKGAVESWPQWSEQFMLDSVPDSSWRLLALRLPSMMRFVTEQARFDISDGLVVANMYLPHQALPQVTMATVLAMNTPMTSPAETKVSETPPSLSIEEMLNREMTISFDQESLEFALEAITDAFKQSLPTGSTLPPARIIGGDLELMGITQNQQVRDFSKSNMPLRAVLTDLVVGANPDKSATGPSDPKQSLIWVVAEDPSTPGEKEILITTRQAAATKQYAIPSEFQTETTGDQ